MPEQPTAIDLFCGRGGWAHAFMKRGYRVIGYDIKRWRKYANHAAYPGELTIIDVRRLTREMLPARPAVVLASPPCTEFSKHDQPGLFPNLEPPSLDCVEAAFRIAGELSSPLILENVRGLQKFIGQAVNHYGSFYFWGDVPALLPHCPRWTALKGARAPAVRAMIPEEVAAYLANHFWPAIQQ